MVQRGVMGNLSYNESQHAWTTEVGKYLAKLARLDEENYKYSAYSSHSGEARSFLPGIYLSAAKIFRWVRGIPDASHLHRVEHRRLVRIIRNLLRDQDVVCEIDDNLSEDGVYYVTKKVLQELRSAKSPLHTAFARIAIAHTFLQYRISTHTEYYWDKAKAQLTAINNESDENSMVEVDELLKVLEREENLWRDSTHLLRELTAPLTILLVLADPATEATLRLGDEKRALEQALRETRFGDSVVVQDLPSCRLDDLGRGLRDHTPQIVHFSGHGGDDGLVFVGSNNEAVSRDLRLLGNLLRNAVADGLEAVILNACDQATQAQPLADVVGRVIAMQGWIEDPSAIAFTKSFYSTLGSGKSFETAYLWAVDETAWNTSEAGAKPGIFFSTRRRHTQGTVARRYFTL
jgi:hypothetical protein